MFAVVKVVDDNHLIPGAVKEYICTSADDIAMLPRHEVAGTSGEKISDAPCGYGSTAIVCTGESSDVYILTPDNNWTLM